MRGACYHAQAQSVKRADMSAPGQGTFTLVIGAGGKSIELERETAENRRMKEKEKRPYLSVVSLPLLLPH